MKRHLSQLYKDNMNKNNYAIKGSKNIPYFTKTLLDILNNISH